MDGSGRKVLTIGGSGVPGVSYGLSCETTQVRPGQIDRNPSGERKTLTETWPCLISSRPLLLSPVLYPIPSPSRTHTKLSSTGTSVDVGESLSTENSD